VLSLLQVFLDSTAPLYGRADEIMRLTPIRLPYIQEALNLNAMNAIEEYAVWGGVPRYWELRENRISLDDAMWHNILSVNGALYEEPIKLLQDDVKDIVKTSTIMSYIGTGANRLSEIAARCNEPATNLSRPLKKLVDLGFFGKKMFRSGLMRRMRKRVSTRLPIRLWRSTISLLSLIVHSLNLVVAYRSNKL